MQCPFLKKMNVKFCGLCKLAMIPLNGADLATEQCCGPEYRKCSLVREHHDGILPPDSCPYLSVGDVHYCAAASFQKLIPVNQTTISRCTDDGHRYCEIYLSHAGADTPQTTAGATDDEVPMPNGLAYAANHMWLDCRECGTCHVGVDGFFARALGRIDEVEYLSHGGGRRPTVRFRAGGVDFDLIFPNVMQGTEINAHVVAHPNEVLDDPYGRGWLFEGVTLPGCRRDASSALDAGMLRGESARDWMQDECRRLGGFVQEHLAEGAPDVGRLVQDGGTPSEALVTVLDRPSLVRLHSEFFTYHPERTQS